MLKTSRGLIKYILLTLITLGIYNLYVIYRAAKDANLADTQDKKVGGLIFYIIFTILTLGIYSFYWYYRVTEKFANVIESANEKPSITGGAFLLWDIFGAIIIVGPFIAMYKFIKNWNRSNAIYNSRHK